MGLPKFSGALAPVPSWLSPAAEVHEPGVKMGREVFVPWCVDSFVAAGAPLPRAFELTGCKITETGWGGAFRGWNAGGVKATKAWADAYRKRTGREPGFYRAHGNVGTGDAQTVIYRAYNSAAEFFAEWMATFVPKAAGPTHRYAETGRQFWSGGDWFPAMLQAGYRGPVTKARPSRAIADQESLTKAARTFWTQSKLAAWQKARGHAEVIKVDGAWGPKSTAAARAFQASQALPLTGEPDDRTVTTLSTVAL